MEDIIIDLKNFLSHKETALIGRENGQNMLKKLKSENIILCEYEKKYEIITIKIPEKIITMNKSFFLGLLATRVVALGKDRFISIYKFDTNDYIINKIKNSYIDSAMLIATMEDILNA